MDRCDGRLAKGKWTQEVEYVAPFNVVDRRRVCF
jgi:hypothetical protein